MTRTAMLSLVLILLGPGVRGDVWDTSTDNDNDTGTDNELIHGLSQVHDLAAQGGGTVVDADWYRVQARFYSSYELVFDSSTGDSASNVQPSLERLDSTGAVVLQSATSLSSFGTTRALRWVTGLGTGEETNFVRVTDPPCALTCAPSDQYRVRFYETTYAIPRFNNSASQATLLVIQNPTPEPVTVYVRFWGGAGTALASVNAAIAPRGAWVLNTAVYVDLQGQSGSITVLNDAGYGALAGKAVAVEPATGFTFDTAMVPRPY